MTYISVIGCGPWGKNIIRNLSKLKSLYSICDENTIRSSEIAKQYNVESSNLKDIINDKKITSIAVATSVENHDKIIELGLKHNKNLFVEKPYSLNEKILSLSEKISKEKSLKIMVGHLMLYHNGFLKVKELVKSGIIGKILHIDSYRLSFGRFRKFENVLWSFSPHDLSMITSILGYDLLSLSAQAQNYYNRKIDSVILDLKFKNNITATVHNSWSSPFDSYKLIIKGSKSMVIFDDCQDWNKKIFIQYFNTNYQKTRSEYIEIQNNTEPLFCEMSVFIDYINNKIKNIPSDLLQNREIFNIIQKSEESIKIDRRVFFN